MNSYLIGIIVLIVVVIGGYIILSGNGETTFEPIEDSVRDGTSNMQQNNDRNMEDGRTNGTSTEDAVNQHVVAYTDSGYDPETITIKAGETVTWQNTSASNMWTASAIHPTHAEYGGTTREEHCPDPSNTAFDTCNALAPGSSWGFTFEEAGSWNYHNHERPTHTGTVVVE